MVSVCCLSAYVYIYVLILLFVYLPNSLYPLTSMYQFIHLFTMHLHLLIDLLIQLLLCLYIYVLIFSFINLIDLFVLWRSVPRQKHHLFFVWEGSPAIIDDTAWIVPPPPWWENGAEQHRGPRHPRHRGGPNNGLGGCRNQRGGPENMGVVKGSMWRVLFFWAVDLLYKGATLWGVNFQ